MGIATVLWQGGGDFDSQSFCRTWVSVFWGSRKTDCLSSGNFNSWLKSGDCSSSTMWTLRPGLIVASKQCSVTFSLQRSTIGCLPKCLALLRSHAIAEAHSPQLLCKGLWPAFLSQLSPAVCTVGRRHGRKNQCKFFFPHSTVHCNGNGSQRIVPH